MFDQRIIQAVKLIINTFGFDATRLAIAQHWEALADPTARMLLEAQFPRHEQSSAEYNVIETRLYAIERCISDGIDAVFSGYEQAAKSILSLLDANTWDEISEALMTGQDQLLAEVSDIAFADLVMQPSPDKERSCILVGWDLTKMCRALDIDEAISQYRARDSRGAKEPVRALRIGQLPDGRWSVAPEESSREPVQPKQWLSVLSPDSLGFLYLHSVHSGEEYDQYRPLAQFLSQQYGLGSTRQVIEQHWDALKSSKVREILAYQLLSRRYELPSPEQRVAKARLEAVERCISDGVDSVFSGYEAATESVLLLLNANNWDQVRKVIESNRHSLFPEIADIAFADLVAQPVSDDEKDHILGGWNLIRRCRELGVEAAFEWQLQETRGTISGPQSQAYVKLASATSVEEIHQGLLELAPIRRRQEGQAQAEEWDGFEDYLAAMGALAAPEDLPERIETCRAALDELDRAKVPLVWAMVSLDLADGLGKQLEELAAPDMTEVIALYQDALTVLTAKGEADQFGHAHHYLGDAYVLHGGGDPAENIESAIEHYEKALGMRRPGAEPIPWATTMAHLGEAFNQRLQGDRTVNLDRAVDTLEQAIGILEVSDEQVLLGAAYLSLGAALTERITGSRAENLDRAVKVFNLAIETVEPSKPSHLQVWVLANGNLGSLFWKLAHSAPWNYSALLEQAETHLRLALGRAGAETSPLVQARLHMGLGLVLSDQIDAGGELDEVAIHHYEEAIRLLKEERTAPVGGLGLAYHNLANIYMERISGDRKTNIASAESHFLSALDAYSGSDCLVERRDTLRAFGKMCFQEEDWEKAGIHFQEAIQISEEILGGCYTEPGKEAEVAKNRTLYSYAVFCLLKLKRFAEALETLERGKARMLNEALGWKDLQVSTLSTQKQQALQWARDQIVRLEAESRLTFAHPEPERQARLGRQLTDAYRHLAALRSEASSVSIEELDLETILKEIPTNGALVAPVVTPKASAAFVLPDGLDSLSEKHVVPLDSLTVSVLGELMAGSAGYGGWLNTYGDWLKGAFLLADGILQEELDHLASDLWDILMGPIHNRLKELGVAEQAPVVIIPSGWLGLFPLHAAFRITNGQRRTFGEDFTVSLAPSVRVLSICRQRLAQPQRQGKKLLAIANPTEDLQFAGTECRVLADMFIQQQQSPEAAVILPGNRASRANVVRELKGPNYHHFSCHGRFHWTNPAGSGLKLAKDDWLYLPDILSFDVDLGTSRLVSLSACETGLSEFRDMPDEFIGLPGAFLEGGAPAVVSTLWSVDEVSTKFLMTEFYRLHLDGQSVAAALRASQKWLRTSSARQLGLAKEYQRIYAASGQTNSSAKEKWDYYKEHPDDVPFEHPFYWAAFTLTGAYNTSKVFTGKEENDDS